MYSSRDVEQSSLEVFKQNEKWQKLIKEFLTAWDAFYTKKTGHKRQKDKTHSLSVRAEGICINWVCDYHSVNGVHCGLTLQIFHRRSLWKVISVMRLHDEYGSGAWEVTGVNYDHLPDITAATRLLGDRAVVAEDACEAHKDRMEIHNDYLDGLAELL